MDDERERDTVDDVAKATALAPTRMWRRVDERTRCSCCGQAPKLSVMDASRDGSAGSKAPPARRRRVELHWTQTKAGAWCAPWHPASDVDTWAVIQPIGTGTACRLYLSPNKLQRATAQDDVGLVFTSIAMAAQHATEVRNR